MPEEVYRLKMENVAKSFGGVHALKNVTFTVKPGEIHALVGENGAGKSTLMKILSGAYQRDAGTISIDGEEVDISSPKKAKELGVGIVYQEFELAPDLSIAENIFLEKLSRTGIVNWKALYRDADELIRSLGFEMDTRKKVSSLSVAYQQVVEIAKIISKNVRILILDEPTAVLSQEEVDKLFGILKRLRDTGVSVIYISHRLEELFGLCDSITTLRDGQVTGTRPLAGMNKDDVIRLMIGRELASVYPKRDVQIGEEVIRISNFSDEKMFHDVSFSVKAGEVVGISGLIGSGRTETVRALFGADKRKSGSITYMGKQVNFASPEQAVKAGIALVPENRKEQGLVLGMQIRENVTMADISQVSSRIGVINHKKDTRVAQELGAKLALKMRDVFANASSLSGGNQQKVVLAKWFHAGAKVIIFDEPTRGVDVGAKVEIYNLINEMAAEGAAVIMISSEMNEIIGMCDRILVMCEGRITGELTNKEDFTEMNIMRYAVRGGRA